MADMVDATIEDKLLSELHTVCLNVSKALDTFEAETSSPQAGLIGPRQLMADKFRAGKREVLASLQGKLASQRHGLGAA